MTQVKRIIKLNGINYKVTFSAKYFSFQRHFYLTTLTNNSVMLQNMILLLHISVYYFVSHNKRENEKYHFQLENKFIDKNKKMFKTWYEVVFLHK